VLGAAGAAVLRIAGTTPKTNSAPAKPVLSATTLTVNDRGFLTCELLPESPPTVARSLTRLYSGGVNSG
jgi:hypothetical protein